MPYSLVKESDMYIVLDSKEDIENVPTTVAPGTVAKTADGLVKYILSPSKVWTLYTEGKEEPTSIPMTKLEHLIYQYNNYETGDVNQYTDSMSYHYLVPKDICNFIKAGDSVYIRFKANTVDYTYTFTAEPRDAKEYTDYGTIRHYTFLHIYRGAYAAMVLNNVYPGGPVVNDSEVSSGFNLYPEDYYCADGQCQLIFNQMETADKLPFPFRGFSLTQDVNGSYGDYDSSLDGRTDDLYREYGCLTLWYNLDLSNEDTLSQIREAPEIYIGVSKAPEGVDTSNLVLNSFYKQCIPITYSGDLSHEYTDEYGVHHTWIFDECGVIGTHEYTDPGLPFPYITNPS